MRRALSVGRRWRGCGVAAGSWRLGGARDQLDAPPPTEAASRPKDGSGHVTERGRHTVRPQRFYGNR